MSIADVRREYNLAGLRRRDLEAEPIAQFKRWFDQATGARTSGRLLKLLTGIYKSILACVGSGGGDVTAMTLATGPNSKRNGKGWRAATRARRCRGLRTGAAMS